MITRRTAILACATSLAGFAAEETTRKRIRFERVPQGGLQPQVEMDDGGALHLVYYLGDAHRGDLFYVKSQNGGKSFSRPLRINSEAGSAIATGTIRGAQIALGGHGRVHVAWNGSKSGPRGMPMLYSRLNDGGNAFEAQRSMAQKSFGMDGGGSIAADRSGNVYVAWHGMSAGADGQDEARRRVWIARSRDEGRSFSPEQPAWTEETGACGCCGMKIFAGRGDNVFALYRSATQSMHRDVYVLKSTDRAGTFEGRLLHKWDINACPMSSMDIAGNGSLVMGAWETAGQVYWARLDGGASQPASAPGEGNGRKHPRVVLNRGGEMLLVWTEGTGWEHGGSLACQLYGRDGKPASEKLQIPGIATWSFASVSALPDNAFLVLY